MHHDELAIARWTALPWPDAQHDGPEESTETALRFLSTRSLRVPHAVGRVALELHDQIVIALCAIGGRQATYVRDSGGPDHAAGACRRADLRIITRSAPHARGAADRVPVPDVARPVYALDALVPDGACCPHHDPPAAPAPELLRVLREVLSHCATHAREERVQIGWRTGRRGLAVWVGDYRSGLAFHPSLSRWSDSATDGRRPWTHLSEGATPGAGSLVRIDVWPPGRVARGTGWALAKGSRLMDAPPRHASGAAARRPRPRRRPPDGASPDGPSPHHAQWLSQGAAILWLVVVVTILVMATAGS